jgi:hypothetical protein
VGKAITEYIEEDSWGMQSEGSSSNNELKLPVTSNTPISVPASLPAFPSEYGTVQGMDAWHWGLLLLGAGLLLVLGVGSWKLASAVRLLAEAIQAQTVSLQIQQGEQQ